MRRRRGEARRRAGPGGQARRRGFGAARGSSGRRVAGQQHPAGGAGMHAGARGEIDDVFDKNQAAAVVDLGKRQREPARDESQQGAEIALDTRPIDQRGPQDDELEPGLLRGRVQRVLDGELAAAIGVAGERRVCAAERCSRQGRVAHRPDRAEVDEPPHPGARRGARQGRGRLGLFLRARVPHRAVGPVGEMNDGLDPVEMPGPVGLPADVTDRAQLDTRHRFARAPGSAEDNMAAVGQPAAQRSADKSGRAGHQDAQRASTCRGRPRLDWARARRANALERCRHQPNSHLRKWRPPISPQGRWPRYHRPECRAQRSGRSFSSS